MQHHTLKRGDTSASLIYQLSPASVDLTNSEVRFTMRSKHRKSAVKITRAVAVIVTESGTPTVQYDWQAQDVDTEGWFEAEFEVTYPGGAVETFPNQGFILVRISKDIA